MRLNRRTAGTSGLTARATERSVVEMDGRPPSRGTEPGLQTVSPGSTHPVRTYPAAHPPCAAPFLVTPLTGANGGGKIHLSGSKWGKVG